MDGTRTALIISIPKLKSSSVSAGLAIEAYPLGQVLRPFGQTDDEEFFTGRARQQKS